MTAALRDEAWGQVVKTIPVRDGGIEIRHRKKYSAFIVVGAISMYQCLGNGYQDQNVAEKAALKAVQPSVGDVAREAWRMNKEMWRKP